MADNVAITAGTGTSIAADDIGGVMHQRVKLALGADGTAVDAVAGAGAVSTAVQRVTLASDDPAVTSLSLLAASASVLDDWDESDRAKVNVIVGQAGVTAGAGAVAANTPRFTLASDDTAVTKLTNINKSVEGDYETVAASQTAQALGATGATGDFLSHVLVIPATTSPGAVTLLDNATSITIFAGGASSVTSLIPFAIPIMAKSVSGAWKLTTGANVSAIGFGDFT